MKRITLLCNSGLSTGVLIKKMKASVDVASYDCEISAASVADVEMVGAEADITLLRPQVRFQMEMVKKQVPCPVVSIDPMAYGTTNGEKVLNQARKEMGD